MTAQNEEIKKNLDFLFKTNPEEYVRYLNMVKTMGFKVLRNSQGLHVVQLSSSVMNYILTQFGISFDE